MFTEISDNYDVTEMQQRLMITTVKRVNFLSRPSEILTARNTRCDTNRIAEHRVERRRGGELAPIARRVFI